MICKKLKIYYRTMHILCYPLLENWARLYIQSCLHRHTYISGRIHKKINNDGFLWGRRARN